MLDDRSTLPCRKHLASVPDCMLTSHLRFSASYNIQQVISFSQLIYTIIPLKYVGVRKLQVAILARSSREMSLTVSRAYRMLVSSGSTSCQEFASQLGLAFFFVYAKNSHKLSRKPILAHLAVEWTSGTGNNAVTFEWPATRQSRINCGNTVPKQRNQPVETATIRVYTFTA